MKRRLSEWDKGFIQGFTCAVVSDISNHGMRTEVEDLWRGNSNTEETLRLAGVPETDIEVLKQHNLI